MKTLVNKMKRAQTFNLPCPDPAKCGEIDCFCKLHTTQLQETLEDGTTGIREVERKLAGSITLLSSSRTEVPDWVAESPEVKAALARGALRLVTGN